MRYIKGRALFVSSLLALTAVLSCERRPRPLSQRLEAGQTITLRAESLVVRGEEPELRFVTEGNEVLGIDIPAMGRRLNDPPFWLLDDTLGYGRTCVATLTLEYTKSVAVSQFKRPLPCFTITGVKDEEILRVSEYAVEGKDWNRQVCRKTKTGSVQVTQFEDWENVSARGVFVSPDGRRMAVYHRPDKSQYWLLSLYDLETDRKIAEIEPGVHCDGIRWTERFIIYTWGTTGGGTRFVYLAPDSLAESHTISAFRWFVDEEDDLLLRLPVYGPEDGLVTIYRYSDGSELQTVSFYAEAGRWYVAHDCKKTAPRSYELELETGGDGPTTIRTVSLHVEE